MDGLDRRHGLFHETLQSTGLGSDLTPDRVQELPIDIALEPGQVSAQLVPEELDLHVDVGPQLHVPEVDPGQGTIGLGAGIVGARLAGVNPGRVGSEGVGELLHLGEEQGIRRVLARPKCGQFGLDRRKANQLDGVGPAVQVLDRHQMKPLSRRRGVSVSRLSLSSPSTFTIWQASS